VTWINVFVPGRDSEVDQQVFGVYALLKFSLMVSTRSVKRNVKRTMDQRNLFNEIKNN
jgi:hypothetical protein